MNSSILGKFRCCDVAHGFALRVRAVATPLREATSSHTRCITARATTEHNQHQTALFNTKSTLANFVEPLPQNVEERLARIASSVPLDTSSRVIDVGAGTGCLIPHIQATGCEDILAVDLAPLMLDTLKERFGSAGTLGNDVAVRTWNGDILDLPSHQGRAQAIFMNSVFGNFPNQHEVLVKCAISLLQPNGYIVISHPLGRAWLQDLHEEHPKMVPSTLPDRAELDALVHDLPLEVVDFVDEDEFYCCTLKIPDQYALKFQMSAPAPPLRLKGPVVTGFQRGSKEMGIPTANISPAPLEKALEGYPRGVYFGWAKLMDPVDPDDSVVAPMVMNVGYRPTIQDGSNISVEAHILHAYSDDFYGKELRVVVLGFVRPEIKMNSLDMLIKRINIDISIASEILKTERALSYRTDSFFE